MPRGGARAGGGRPTKAAQAAKAAALAEAAAKGPKLSPRQYLQALLDSPASSKSERLRAAELLLKLAPDSPPPSVPLQQPAIILAIPRGCFLSAEQCADPEQLISHGVPIEPYTGSVDWTKSPVVEPAPIEPIVECQVTEINMSNVVRLERRDSDDNNGPDAA